MPRIRIAWTLLAKDISTYESDMLLESLKDYVVDKSGLSPCSLCAEPTPHNMRTRLLLCKCKACKAVAPYARCAWKGKVQTCILANTVNVSETSQHVSPLRPARRPKMTEAMKALARDMCTYNHKPMNIFNGIVRRFEGEGVTMPTLTIVQRFVQHYRRAHLGGSDFHDDVTAKVREHAFRGEKEASQPFTLTWRSNTNGDSIVGRGSDADAFVVGISSKELLPHLDRDPSEFVLLIDATYKLSQVDYPLVVIGVSDRMSSFHVVAFFAVSQQTEAHFTEVLALLRRMYATVTGKQLTLRYVMADADKAQRNAVDAVLGAGNELVNLMFYFHVAAHVYKHTRGIPVALAARVARDVADMHCTASPSEFTSVKTRCVSEWQRLSQLCEFANYFSSTWLVSPFHRWQAFHTPRGFAATNNPVEQFNRAIKRDYTLRSRLKMGTLLDQLMLCIRTEAARSCPFATTVDPRPELLRRVREMQKLGLLREVTPTKVSIGFLVGDTPPTENADVVFVVSQQLARVYDPQDRRTKEALPVTACLSAQKARMETQDMPAHGWKVNLQFKTCGCRVFMKVGCCIHLVHALAVRDRMVLFGRARLVYRGRNNKARRQRTEQQNAGRPAANGRALELD